MYSRYWRFIGIPQPGLTKVPSLRFLQALLQIGLVRSNLCRTDGSGAHSFKRIPSLAIEDHPLGQDRPCEPSCWPTLPRRRCNVAAAIAALSSQILQIGCKQALDLANRLTDAASASPVIAEHANFEAFYQAETGRPYDRAHAHSGDRDVFERFRPALPSPSECHLGAFHRVLAKWRRPFSILARASRISFSIFSCSRWSSRACMACSFSSCRFIWY